MYQLQFNLHYCKYTYIQNRLIISLYFSFSFKNYIYTYPFDCNV